MRYTTLREIDAAGQDVRVWCWRCARGTRVDAIIWQVFEERGWSDDLRSAASRFRCKLCTEVDQVALYPARRPARTPITGTDLIAGYFHAARKAGKRRR